MNVMLDVDMESLLNQAIIQEAQAEDRDYSHFHPSEFDNCHRKLVYKYYEYNGIIQLDFNNDAIDPKLQRIFGNGHHVHFRLGGNLQRTGVLKGRWKCAHADYPGHPGEGLYGYDEKLGIHQPKQCECGLSKFKYREVGFLDEPTMLGGHVDGILDLRGYEIEGAKVPSDASEVDSHVVIDFKSMRQEAFKFLSGPKPTHYCQMQVYLFLSGLKFGKFLYENKNTQDFKEYLVVRDEEFIAARVEEAKALKKIVKSTNSQGQRTLPPRPSHLKDNSKECMECRYRAHCWKLK
jgi:hypothetical protein